MGQNVPLPDPSNYGNLMKPFTDSTGEEADHTLAATAEAADEMAASVSKFGLDEVDGKDAMIVTAHLLFELSKHHPRLFNTKNVLAAAVHNNLPH